MRKNIYSLMLIALPLLAACNNDDEQVSTTDNVALQVSVKNCLTRSIITGSSLSEDSQMGIYVADKDNNVSNYNVKGTVKGDYCLLTNTVSLTDEPSYVYAYYPYSSSYNNATAIPYDATEQTDILMGYSDDGTGILDYVDKQNPTANMLLTHALARVTLNVKKAAENSNAGELTLVGLNNVANSGTINLLEHSSNGDSNLGTISLATSTTLTANDEATFDLLVAPTPSLSASQLVLTVDGETIYVSIPTTRATEWTAGKQYKYTVIVGENSNVKISDAEINLWNNNQQEEITISRALEITTSIADTRSVVTGSSFAEGDEVGIFAYDEDGNNYSSSSSNAKATLTNSHWQFSPKIALNSEKAYVYGYYPYDSNATISGDSIKIDVNPDWKIGQRDYMYSGCAVADSLNYKTNMTFNHALSRITLAIKKGVNDKGDGNITAVKLSNGAQGSEIAETGWMSIKNGTIERIENTDDNISLNVSETATTSGTVNLEILVLPNQSRGVAARPASPVVCTLTIDGTPHEFTISNPQWYSGEQYTYPITLNRQ